MPLISDYSEDDEEGPISAGSGGGLSAGGGARLAQASKQQEKEFTPWSRFVSANQDVTQREAGKLGSSVEARAKDVGQRANDAVVANAQAVGSNYRQQTKPSFGSIAPQMGEQPQPAAGSSFGKAWSGFVPPSQQPEPQQPTVGAIAAPPRADALTASGNANAAQPLVAPDRDSRVIDPDRLKTDVSSGAPVTSGFGLTGAKDLKGAMGEDAWTGLIGDAIKTEGAANALGSQEGVQSLLKNRGGTAFDAALVGGAGGDQFRDLSKQYGGDALRKQLLGADNAVQGDWKRLMGDVDSASASRDAEINAATTEMNRKAAADAAAAAAKKVTGEDIETPTDLHELLYGKDGQDFFSTMHQAGLSFSPADWASIWAAAESGNDLPMPTEEFSKNFDYTGGKIQQSWPQGRFQMAYGIASKEFSKEAMGAFVKALGKNPEMLKAYLAMKNPGYMLRQMRMWMENQGYSKKTDSGQLHETKGVTTTVNGETRTTTDEQESARLQAYRDGWGTEWDKQFYQDRNDNPQRGG